MSSLCEICEGEIPSTRSKGSVTCSTECLSILRSGILSNRRIKITDEDIKVIKKLRSDGLSSYKIHKETGLARNTIMRYW